MVTLRERKKFKNWTENLMVKLALFRSVILIAIYKDVYKEIL